MLACWNYVYSKKEKTPTLSFQPISSSPTVIKHWKLRTENFSFVAVIRLKNVTWCMSCCRSLFQIFLLHRVAGGKTEYERLRKDDKTKTRIPEPNWTVRRGAQYTTRSTTQKQNDTRREDERTITEAILGHKTAKLTLSTLLFRFLNLLFTVNTST